MPVKLSDALEQRRARVDDALAGCFSDIAVPELRDAASWYPEAGGKRLRPVMALLSCEASGGAPQSALPAALAVELIHNFSLVHDDIMDHDDTRRGRPTVHRKWDDATAILAGDVLFARAFEILGGIPDAQAHHDASVLLSRAIRRLCEGQALDVAFESRPTVSVDEYLDMIQGKTASLFEAACRAGALASPLRTPEAVEALGKFGDAFGMAFQIADDVLDVVADSSTLGKPWGSDIRAGKRTVLVLDALERGTPEQRATVESVLGTADASESDVKRAVDALRDSGAIERAIRLRDDYARRADEALEALPKTDARDVLREVNEWARVRGF